MARVRFIGPEPVTVPELGERVVEPDQVVEVPDERYEGYVCQPQTWEAVEEPKSDPVPTPVKKSAAKPQKDEA
ncbi:hypothetical protein [Streptomyces luteocolor]|uniref:hypothetical protein n=1 Tax=Streptomyces luteocolor TaxID=285500 RepID=UPI000853562E|nr:hypothetical protein [Streptomyces luteocolor]